jgi:hypothetical protein
VSIDFSHRIGVRNRHRDPWLGLGYVVCLGRDLWRELVAVLEAETCRTAPGEEDSAGEDDEEPDIDETEPGDCGMDSRCPGRLDLAARSTA